MPLTIALQDEILSDIETFDKDLSLYSEKNFKSRIQAIDFIEFHIIDRINAEFGRAAKDPELIRRITATGMAVRTSTPQQMGELMVSENAKVGALVERLNLKQ